MEVKSSELFGLLVVTWNIVVAIDRIFHPAGLENLPPPELLVKSI